MLTLCPLQLSTATDSSPTNRQPGPRKHLAAEQRGGADHTRSSAGTVPENIRARYPSEIVVYPNPYGSRGAADSVRGAGYAGLTRFTAKNTVPMIGWLDHPQLPPTVRYARKWLKP